MNEISTKTSKEKRFQVIDQEMEKMYKNGSNASSEAQMSEVKSEVNLGTQEKDPRGTFGNIVHALTFGLFGNQKDRIDRHVETEYRVKSNDEDQKGGVVDNHPYEEYNDESVAQSSNSTENIYQTNYNGSNKRLVKFKKSAKQKDQEAESLQREEQMKRLSRKER